MFFNFRVYFMKRFFFVLTVLFFFTTYVFGEYRMQPVQCTLKKNPNCGAYLYNSNTGATYYCDSEKCKEVMPALEEGSEGEVVEGPKKTKKSKIPKKIKKKKKKSKIPKFKKKKSE